jgi:hypothetical protein
LDHNNFRNFRLLGNQVKLPDHAAVYQLFDMQGNKLQQVGPGATSLDISGLLGGIYVVKSAAHKFRFVK